MGQTLVGHAISVALTSGAGQVIVVVGAEAEAIREAIRDLPVQIVFNPEWREGMGSSIRVGAGVLQTDIGCVVISLCDQPHVTSSHLHSLAARHFQTGSNIVASSYEGVIGAPCAFGRELIPSLLVLHGDSGARELIRNSAKPIEIVDFSGGIIDIDTLEDVEKMNDSGLL